MFGRKPGPQKQKPAEYLGYDGERVKLLPKREPILLDALRREQDGVAPIERPDTYGEWTPFLFLQTDGIGVLKDEGDKVVFVLTDKGRPHARRGPRLA